MKVKRLTNISGGLIEVKVGESVMFLPSHSSLMNVEVENMDKIRQFVRVEMGQENLTEVTPKAELKLPETVESQVSGKKVNLSEVERPRGRKKLND